MAEEGCDILIKYAAAWRAKGKMPYAKAEVGGKTYSVLGKNAVDRMLDLLAATGVSGTYAVKGARGVFNPSSTVAAGERG